MKRTALRVRAGSAVGALALAAGMTLALTGPATATDWEGNGTSNGVCSNNTLDTSLAPDTQVWQFVLTSPGPGPWTLTATFADSGTIMAQGEQQGNGAVHFLVTTSANDTLLSASTDVPVDDESSTLTVSHCTFNNPTPPTTPTTQPAPPTPAANNAVKAAPTFTG